MSSVKAAPKVAVPLGLAFGIPESFYAALNY